MIIERYEADAVLAEAKTDHTASNGQLWAAIGLQCAHKAESAMGFTRSSRIIRLVNQDADWAVKPL